MRQFTASKLVISALLSASALVSANPAISADYAASQPATLEKPIFDEARFGWQVGIDKTFTNDEKGSFITGMVFFDPWNHFEATGWDRFIRPRIHVGGDVSTAGETNQIYAGFSWTVNLTDQFFLEAGFGGSLNDGTREPDGGRGPFVGCNALFHEYVAAGVNLDKNWRIVAQAEHSSHANLCGDTNNGLTRGGVMIGYKF